MPAVQADYSLLKVILDFNIYSWILLIFTVQNYYSVKMSRSEKGSTTNRSLITLTGDIKNSTTKYSIELPRKIYLEMNNRVRRVFIFRGVYSSENTEIGIVVPRSTLEGELLDALSHQFNDDKERDLVFLLDGIVLEKGDSSRVKFSACG